VIDHHPNCPLADLLGKPRSSCHHPILSTNGVSGNPGAVQFSVPAEKRIPNQRRDHRNHVQLDLRALPEVVLAHDRVLDADLELDRQSADLRCLRGEQADGNVPLAAGAGFVVVGDRRVEAELPGVRQIVGEEVEQAEVAGVRRVALVTA
jgi:hypothetical protein